MRPILLLLAALAALPVHAADVWTEPFPGIRYLHRSTSEPKEIHALLIDLDRPEIRIRTTKSGEKGRTVTSFSNLVGAAAAVNGDFYNTNGTYDPVGLAIGEGASWSDDSTGWRFIACTAANDCTIETTSGAVAPDPSWRSAVGGRNLLVKDGTIVQTAEADQNCGEFCTTAHPRTAAGLTADGKTMILVVVEGRQTPILGMSTSRLAALMKELGADDAINLDGGGSSSMVVDGSRVSGRPSNEPAERAVSNHIAVIFDPAAATTGRLVGYVREADIYDASAGLAGATVTLSDGQSTTTNADGFYEFAEVAPGDVTVTASKEGFATASADKLVEVGTTNWKSIALQPAPPPPEEDEGVDAGSGEPPVEPPLDGGAGGEAPPDAGDDDDDDRPAADSGAPVDDEDPLGAVDGGQGDAEDGAGDPDGAGPPGDAAGGCRCLRPGEAPGALAVVVALVGLAAALRRRPRRRG